MAFLTFDETLGEPPDLTDPVIRAQLVPYAPEPDPLTDSPIENWASEMARQITRMTEILNGNLIATQDVIRQGRAWAKALNEAAQSAAGPTQTLARTPAPSAVQARNSQAAAADWNRVPVPNSTLTPEQQARFWRKVIRTPEHWIWRGAIDRVTGRGQIRIDKKLHYAHRVAYTLHTGNPLEGENLKNVCGEPLCVWPNHQRPGSIGAELRAPRQSPERIEHDRALLEGAAHRYDEYLEESRTTEAILNMDTTPYALDRYGHKKLCRKGHFLTTQPSGRVTCRPCDLDRKRRYEIRTAQVNQREQMVNTVRTELADGLDRELNDLLLAQILPAEAPLPEPTTEFLPRIVEETADMAGYEEAYDRTVADTLSNLRMLRPTKNPEPES